MKLEARCMKCKEQKKMKEANIVKTKKGGYMAKGVCTDCGCKMCRILSKDNAKILAEELKVALPE